MSDPYPTDEMVAGAQALAAHRCMKNGTEFTGRNWDRYSDVEKMNALAEAEVVINALRRLAEQSRA